jgi:hypothetical protein
MHWVIRCTEQHRTDTHPHKEGHDETLCDPLGNTRLTLPHSDQRGGYSRRLLTRLIFGTSQPLP